MLTFALSQMIMGGNWIVGSYKIPFFESSTGDNNTRLRKVLAGAIPWLSSTQGFSRAIAQLLVYSVIPLVLNGKQVTEQAFDGLHAVVEL